MLTKIRTSIITLIAASSFAAVAVAPNAAQALNSNGNGITQGELEKEGATCEYVATDFYECKDTNGKKWYCNHEGCQSVRIVGGVTNMVVRPTTLKMSEPPVEPPVVTTVRPPAAKVTLAR